MGESNHAVQLFLQQPCLGGEERRTEGIKRRGRQERMEDGDGDGDGIPSREKPRSEMLIRSPPLPALDRSSRAGDHASSSASQSGWPCQTVELDIPYIPGQIQGENGRGKWGASRVELTGPQDSRRLTASSRAMCCVGVPGRWWLTGSDGTKQRTSRKGKGVGRGRYGEGNPEAGRPGGFVKRSNSTGQCDDVPKKK